MDKPVDKKPDASRKTVVTPPLGQLYVYLTDGCNLACRHCWIAPKYNKAGDKSRFLSRECFSSVIEEAIELGLTAIKLTGGEPLLHPDFTELVRIVHDKELRLNVETNGLLCDSGIAGEIAKLPQRFVSVSIDGVDSATHDWVRGVPGAFEHACTAVRNLAAVGIQAQIIMTVMRANIEQVALMIPMAERLGAGSIKFNVLQPTVRGKALFKESLALDIEELISLGRRIQGELARGTKLNLFFDFPMAFRPLKNMFYGNGCAVCGIFQILGVLADGHYALCGIGAHIRELVFGEVGKDSLATVWRDNKTLQTIREGLPHRLEGICSRCLMKGRCLGACLAQNYYRKKSLWAPNWFCEMADAAGLFPESRLLP